MKFELAQKNENENLVIEFVVKNVMTSLKRDRSFIKELKKIFY